MFNFVLSAKPLNKQHAAMGPTVLQCAMSVSTGSIHIRADSILVLSSITEMYTTTK